MYHFEWFSDDYYRLTNRAGVRAARPKAEGNDNYNACWDGNIAPDGTFYFTLSSEGGKCDHAKLVRYDFDRNEIIDCFYSGDVVLPKDRQLPHSKLHTSINFIPRGAVHGDLSDPSDYLVIATTHSTDRARQHPEWMPFGHHNHVWEGFPGSQILVYDPKSGCTESWGTPVTHESIYGAKYDPKHNRLYMFGFMRGHVYSFDIVTRKVRDLGKAAELFNYRLILGADGNIYAGTKSGYLYRINTETDALEDLGYAVPDEPGHYIHNTWYKYMINGRNHPSGRFMYWRSLSSDYFHTLDFKTLEVARAGKLLPGDGLIKMPSEWSDNECDTFVLDKYGVLWYHYRVWVLDSDLPHTMPVPNYLMRWDVENGKEPECLGIIGGWTDYTQTLTTEMEYDPVRDILYCVSVGRGFGSEGPDVVAFDLKEFRKHMYEPGPVSTDPALRPHDLTPEQIKTRAENRLKRTGEENTEHNPFQAFPNENVYPVRLWRHVPKARIEDSKVIGMAWQPSAPGGRDILHVVTGAACAFDQAAYVFRIRGREVLGRVNFADIGEEYRAWLKANILPQPVEEFAEDVKLPEATGRRYRAKASAVCEWHDGRKFVGTLDALAALVSPEGKVYALGNAAAYGPIRCVCTNAAKTKLWGVAGDDEDMGYVFTYDDDEGLRQLGILNYNSHGYYGTTAANVLSSIALSPDEHTLAIGCSDRIASVHLVTL